LAIWPVYHQAPLYRLLAQDSRLSFTAIFMSSVGTRPYAHEGYGGDEISWGIDPLDGYHSIFLRRSACDRECGGFLTFRDYDIVPTLLRMKFDVLWIHDYYTLTYLLAVASQCLCGRGVLFRAETSLLAERPFWKRALKRALLPLVLREVHGVYIGSESHRWFRFYGMPEERLTFGPYAIDSERLLGSAGSTEGRKRWARASLGLDDSMGPVILFVGRMIETKQPLAVLDAFRRVRTNRKCVLLMVGTGKLLGEVREGIQRDSIPDVICPGFLDQNEIASAYLAADVFCLFSRADTWGFVVNEAMTFGLPLIVSDRVASATDLVRDGVNGYVVSHRDVDALARIMDVLVRSEGLRARLGTSSEKIVRRWNHEAAAAGIVDGVRRIVGEDRWLEANCVTGG
jgi:glycosyltransferase involved in cell wall biosynthesis